MIIYNNDNTVNNSPSLFLPTVDIKAAIRRFSNGTVLLTWQLPPIIQQSGHFSIEVKWGRGRGWIPVTPGLHSPAHFEPNMSYTIQLRFRKGNWEGLLTAPIPPAESNVTEVQGPSSGGSTTEVALLYSVIIGSMLVACAVLVVIILSLKYVQWSRRDSDKGKRVA